MCLDIMNVGECGMLKKTGFIFNCEDALKFLDRYHVVDYKMLFCYCPQRLDQGLVYNDIKSDLLPVPVRN